MGIDRRILVPDMYGEVEARTTLSQVQMAERVGTALATRFDLDIDGVYEELEASVAKILGIRFGLYVDSTDVKDGIQIRVDFHGRFSHKWFSQSVEGYELVNLPIAEFVANFLSRKMQIRFEPLPAVVSMLSDERMPQVAPAMRAGLYVDTDLALAQVTARVGAALGINFSFGDARYVTQGKGSRFWYSRFAHTMAHRVGIHAHTGSVTPLPRPIAVTVEPEIDAPTLGLNLSHLKVVELDITDYLIAMLRYETDLPWMAGLPPQATEQWNEEDRYQQNQSRG